MNSFTRYSGSRCEIDLGPQCRTDSCLNQGVCQESPDGDSIYCSCKAGFFGDRYIGNSLFHGRVYLVHINQLHAFHLLTICS